MRSFFLFLLFLFLSVDAHFPYADFIKTRIDEYLHEKKIPGIAAGIYYHGHAYFFNFGFADPLAKTPVTSETVFEIASLTKLFTTAIFAYYINRGLINPKEFVGAIIPFVGKNDLALKNVTLQQLAAHISGLPRTSPVPKCRMTKERVLHALTRWHPESAPGTKFHYSNLGYNILGYALEEVTKKPYETLVQDIILKPLGMKETMVRVSSSLHKRYAQGFNKKGIPVPHMHIPALGAAGAFKSTITDMMKFLKAQISACTPYLPTKNSTDYDKLIEALRLTHQGSLLTTEGERVQAFGWEGDIIDGQTIFDKNGGVTGFSTWFGFIPQRQMGIVLLTNRRNPNLTFFGRDILAHLALLSSSKKIIKK